ncbi:MAG: hypothetical protein K1X94_18730, partial [Sandaracinaceae bacterium]|nr:hypothetical protein [Sandaracinaceae bacterium]
VPNVVAIPAIIIAIITNITRAPSFEEPQNFRNGTPQNFWNHHTRASIAARASMFLFDWELKGTGSRL